MGRCPTWWPPMQPNIGGALCKSSVIPFRVPRRKVWLTPSGRVSCGNAVNMAERKTWTQSEFCTWQFRQGAKALGNVHTPWVKKGCHPNHGYNFVNSSSICKILSLLQRAVNFQQNSYWVTHHTLSMLLHYLGKLKNQKFALHARKTCFKCDFLSSV